MAGQEHDVQERNGHCTNVESEMKIKNIEFWIEDYKIKRLLVYSTAEWLTHLLPCAVFSASYIHVYTYIHIIYDKIRRFDS